MFMTRGATRNPIFVLMVCIAVVVLSQIALARLPTDLFPKITIPVMTVVTNYSGASPEAVERTVTYPLEQAVTRVAGVQQVLSATRQGLSDIDVYFNWGTDLNNSEVELIQGVQRVMRTLPTGVSQPFVSKFDISNIPVVQVVVGGGGLDARQLRDLAFNVIEPQLERLPGVSQAFVNGGLLREFSVRVDPNKLAAAGLTLQNVQDAIVKYNALVPSGSLRNKRIDYQLNVPSLLQSVPAIQNVVVAMHQGGVPVHIRDIAQVADAAADQTQIVHVDGKPGVVMFVNRQPDANTIQTVNAIRAALPNLTGMPPGVTLSLGFDQSRYIRAAISTLGHEAVIGAVLTFVVVLVFLRSFWSLFIVGLGIPLSVSSALLLLYFTGQSLNVFTLGGLTLAMGRLVDDAIVVRENITRHLAAGGRTVLESVITATQEVGLPVLASTASTCAVFFPVVFLSGISQRLFVPMALTIIFALAASYVVSMTIDPVLSTKLLRAGMPNTEGNGIVARFNRWSEGLMDGLDGRYQGALGWTLRHRAVVLAAIAAVFAISLFAARGIGTEFFPATDESQFQINLEAPQGTAVQVTSVLAGQVAAVVRQVIPPRALVTIYTNSGFPSSGGGFGGNAGTNMANVQVRLVPPTQRHRSTDELANAVRRAFQGKFPGVQLFVRTGGLQNRIVNFGSAAPIDVQLIGFDQQVGAQFAQEIASLVQSTPGTADVQITPRGQYPAFTVALDSEKAAQLGLSTTSVANAVNMAISGNVGTASQFIDPITGNEYNIVVRLMDEYRSHTEDLANIPLAVLADPGPGSTPSTAPLVPIRLRDVAHITLGSQPLQIARKNEQRVIDITANVVDRPLGAVSQEIAAQLDRLPFPAGFTYHLAGQTEQQQNAFGSLGFAMGLALMLVYMIMASQFQSLVDPFVIMFTVPLGIMGVIWMLLLTHTTLSIISFMGVITMVGVVVSNGILLVDYSNKLQDRGLAVREAVLQAGRIRLRPILMTALATILAMIPMATGLGEGSETNMPLARAVIGGLTVSTGLTLLLIPTLYVLFEERFPRRSHKPS